MQPEQFRSSRKTTKKTSITNTDQTTKFFVIVRFFDYGRQQRLLDLDLLFIDKTSIEPFFK